MATGQQWLTTASNGSKNGSAMGATSDVNGLAMGTCCKLIPLPFRCRFVLVGFVLSIVLKFPEVLPTRAAAIFLLTDMEQATVQEL